MTKRGRSAGSKFRNHTLIITAKTVNCLVAQRLGGIATWVEGKEVKSPRLQNRV